MNISIKTVTSPFSFYCVAEDETNNNAKLGKDVFCLVENSKSDRIYHTDAIHGQYVAVYWEDKWARGIVSMESCFMIWLVDQGVYIRPTENTVYVNLPAEYKKLPSKVFEASIHGVTPVGLVLDEYYQFKKVTKLTWSMGAVEKAQQIIQSATRTYFVPVAILSNATNDVVLGDLYLQFKGKGLVNFIDEMSANESSPMHSYLERNNEAYIANLAKLYTSRRLHRACLLKPELPTKDLPSITPPTTLAQYSAICDMVEPFCTQDEEDTDTHSAGGSSVTYEESKENTSYKKLQFSPSEIEMFSNETINVAGREYNLLAVLVNKARDIYMCERYKDAKSVGRATTRIKDCI